MSDSDSEEEYAAIAAWVRKHPCPSKDKVEKWLENAISGYCSTRGNDLSGDNADDDEEDDVSGAALDESTGPSDDDNGDGLQGVLRSLDICSTPDGIVVRWASPKKSDFFDYGSFKKLWEAPLADGREAEKKAQHEVGAALDKKGGIACMRLHYYMINYAMCDAVFYPASERRPRILHFYVNLMSSVWSGIGEWVK